MRTPTDERRRDDSHHGHGHVAPLNPRGRTRSTGRHIDNTATVAEADYADKLRRSAGWTPKHRADDTAGGQS
jgi:hypothetical protein